jgi:membrane dipeptidase
MDGGVLRENAYNVDLAKLRAGDSLAQFFALYVDMKETEDPLDTGLRMLDKFYGELEQNRETIQLATTYQEMMDNHLAGKLSAFLTIEEGGVLKGQMAHLHNFYRFGVRLITLTWNYPNEIGFPNAKGEHREQGLTEFGRDLVAEMNRLGMLIDVSHLSDAGFYDVARLSTKPFLASHSNARSVMDHLRNLTDDMIRTLAEKGGVTGINFCNHFLSPDERSRVADMVKHIRHIRQVGGIDVLAIGTDFDGIDPDLEIANAGEIGKLQQALSIDGFSEAEIEKIFYRNAERLIRDTLTPTRA